MHKGNTYHYIFNNYPILILYLGKDEELPIHFISFCYYGKRRYLCNFCPIHDDFLKLDEQNLTIAVGLNEEGLKEDIKTWINYNNGGKTFFTTTLNNIVSFFLDMCDKTNTYDHGPFFPTNKKGNQHIEEIKND